MRPSVALLGFAFGSAAAITFGLTGVAVVFGLLRKDYPGLASELPALLGNLAAFGVLTAVAGLSFYGQIKRRRWRHAAIAGLLLGIAALGWMHRPA
ncbi:MAG TPA: hypothetical protein VFJ95_12605 [Gammaproteobacteria bacterium]|jgi:uncharacterized membrane protein|nr:hypothetical protein [Gammaproteobacteria bacterium]